VTSSYIELSRCAVEHNQRFVRSQLRPGVDLSVVVKGNAYGHGVAEFVPLAMKAGARHFSVFSDDEARQVHAVLDSQAELMIMGNIDPDNLRWIIANGVQFYVFDLDRLRLAIQIAQELEMPARIHVEVETGMNRTGFNEEQFPALWEMIQSGRQHLRLEGLCTHFAGAESITNHVRVRSQFRRFRKVARDLRDAGLSFARRHTACSAAAIRYPDTQMDMVRSGILNYGFWPTREMLIHYMENAHVQEDPLQRVISWKSYLMSLKTVHRGEYVGYGTSFLCYEPRRIGVVPVGYALGYPRSLSNAGMVLVGGRRVPIIGTINMNALTVDLQHVEDAQLGDEVVIIGRSGDAEASVASFGEQTNLVNYEILTRIPTRIPRQVVD
jgi:alanine racemase